MKKNIKKKKGFTLIELIIVIAIIAILAAIAIPNFLSIQRKSRVKADIASAKTIYDATSALVAENKITSDSLFVVKTGVDNNVTQYLQLVPKSKSINGDVFAVKVLFKDKEAVENKEVEKAGITVYMVPESTTDNKTGVLPDKSVKVYPNGDSPYNLD